MSALHCYHWQLAIVLSVVLGGISLVTQAENATTTVSVPGTSDLWLAGMPDGATASGGDIAPNHSPVLVTGLNLISGGVLTFSALGVVSNYGGCPSGYCNDPDGGGFYQHYEGIENGISNVTTPMNSLIGVFLDDEQPDTSSAPSALNFSTDGISFTSLSPALKQVFFIGDGLTGTGSGSIQTFVIPAGATRLFLGTMDSWGWFDNSGSFTVTVAQAEGGDNVNYTLAVFKTGQGTVTSKPAGINCGATCNAQFAEGASVTLTANPTTGYTFGGWSGGCTNSTGSCILTLNDDTSVTAIFKPRYTLSVSKVGTGTVTSTPAGINCGSDCSEIYASGTKVTLTAAPPTGSTFDGWSGACTNRTGTCAVTMTAARNVTATFPTGSTSTADFVITGIALLPAAPNTGDTFAVAVTVKNTGITTADGGYLDVWANQTISQTCGADGNAWAKVGILAAGASKTFAVTLLRAGAAGPKTLRAFVDSWCQTTETNETNNQFTKTYTVN
jgi:uncharacterized repeat protein (TIGR02543 family)